MEEYTQNYLDYCSAHGMLPQEMLEHDRKKWKGGCMTGFLLWMSMRKRAQTK